MRSALMKFIAMKNKTNTAGTNTALLPLLQRGFSLLEVLIGIVIASAAMVMMAQMSAQSASELKSKNVAESAQAFYRAATTYFIGNRAEMLDAMNNTSDPANAQKHCRINLNADGSGGDVIADPTTDLTCTFDASHLMIAAGLPAGVANNNEAKIRWIATFRQVKDSGGVPTDGVDLLVYGAAPNGSAGHNMTAIETRIAASIMGGNGGAIFEDDQPDCLATEACGGGGGWKVALADFGASKTAVAPNPVAMESTVASYTFFPAELSMAGGGGGSAQLPTATVGDACTTEGAGAITSDGILLTCIDGAFRAPGYIPLVEEGDGCQGSIVDSIVNGTVDATKDGSIGKTGAGLLLSCQSGTWRKAAGGADFSGMSTRRADAVASSYCAISCGTGNFQMPDWHIRYFEHYCSDGAYRQTPDTSGGAPFCHSTVHNPVVANCNADELMTYCSGAITGPRACQGVGAYAMCLK